MAQAPPSSGYYQPGPRPVAPSHFPGYPQQNQQRISSFSSGMANQTSYFAPSYSMTQLSHPGLGQPMAAQPIQQGTLHGKKYSMGQAYRPPPALYKPPTPSDDYFASSKDSMGSLSSPNIPSLAHAPSPKGHQPRSRSFSANSVHNMGSSASTNTTSQPSLVVAPAPDRYHRRKSMVSLSSAAATASSHAHSQSASSITPPSTASSASASTSSSSAMSHPSPTTTNTPLSSSTSSIPNSPVLPESKSYTYKHVSSVDNGMCSFLNFKLCHLTQFSSNIT